MNWLTSVLQAVGLVVDKAVPVAHGARTKIAVVACPLLSYVAGVLPTVAAPLSSSPQAAAAVGAVQAALPYAQAFLCASAPLFALAGLVRDAGPAPTKK